MHEGEPVVSPGTALVGYYIAYDPSTGQQRAAVGSVVSVHAGRKTVSVAVSGVLESGMVGALDTTRGVVLDMSTFRQLTGSTTYSAAVLVLRDASVADRVGEEVRALYPSASVIAPRAILQLVNEYLTSFQVFLGVLAGVSTVITALWIYDTMSISVIQRTREIGILRAVGFKRRYVIALFLGEALIIAAIGVAAGALLLALAQHISPHIFSAAGQSTGAGALRAPHPPFRITSLALNPVLVTAAGALVVAANLLGALVPAYRASRLDIAAALRHE
jgi:putative ABC transport system permease protein